VVEGVKKKKKLGGEGISKRKGSGSPKKGWIAQKKQAASTKNQSFGMDIDEKGEVMGKREEKILGLIQKKVNGGVIKAGGG